MKYTLIVISVIFSNCIIKPPAITFTQSKTAVEQQIVGEENYLEEDGWLISSSMTSSSGSEVWQSEGMPAGAEGIYRKNLSRLLYLAGDLRFLKQKGLLGETRAGFVEKNPVMSKEFSSLPGADREKAEELVKLVNKSRQAIFDLRMEKARREKIIPRKMRKLEKTLRLMYYSAAEKNEYIKMENGEWQKKQ